MISVIVCDSDVPTSFRFKTYRLTRVISWRMGRLQDKLALLNLGKETMNKYTQIARKPVYQYRSGAALKSSITSK